MKSFLKKIEAADQPLLIKAAGTVRLTQIVKELSDSDDIEEYSWATKKGAYEDYDVETSYEPTRPEGEKDADGETEVEKALLDEFHETNPISCLDDFTVELIKFKKLS